MFNSGHYYFWRETRRTIFFIFSFSTLKHLLSPVSLLLSHYIVCKISLHCLILGVRSLSKNVQYVKFNCYFSVSGYSLIVRQNCQTLDFQRNTVIINTVETFFLLVIKMMSHMSNLPIQISPYPRGTLDAFLPLTPLVVSHYILKSGCKNSLAIFPFFPRNLFS